MNAQLVVGASLAAAGVASLSAAVVHERRMQLHRRNGVSYRDVTLRRDGGWRREDLFSAEGLRHQRRASQWGVAGAALVIAGLISWVALGLR